MSSNPPSELSRAQAKLSRVRVRVEPGEVLRKPDWIRVKLPATTVWLSLSSNYEKIAWSRSAKKLLVPTFRVLRQRDGYLYDHGRQMHPPLHFCDVAHGRPDALDPEEPLNLAKTIAAMQLRYVVITSVDRDDLRDGGAGHFAACIDQVRSLNPTTTIEVLVPDFRGKGRDEKPSPFSPIIYRTFLTIILRRWYDSTLPFAREPITSGRFNSSKIFKARYPHIPTKSGAMLGLGETKEELFRLIEDLRAHDVDMLTLGQYLQPSKHHIPVSALRSP